MALCIFDNLVYCVFLSSYDCELNFSDSEIKFSEIIIIMPFVGKDWRSPGEEWVKYDGGWEKKSVVTITTGMATFLDF